MTTSKLDFGNGAKRVEEVESEVLLAIPPFEMNELNTFLAKKGFLRRCFISRLWKEFKAKLCLVE